MKFKNLEEAVTSQGFKFGFELECIMPTDIDWDSLDLKIKFSGTSDSSIKLSDGMDKTEWEPLELVSEPLALNPSSIINVKKSIIELSKNKVKTNSSCGFHVHYSYINMTFIDICWLLTNLSVNPDATKLFTEFEDISFFDPTYADAEFINDIKNYIEMGYPLDKIFGTDKYRIIRIHPQGTMEWRGPRNFMNDSDLSLIDSFFIRLYKNADAINKLISNKSVQVGDKIISKNDFYKELNSNTSTVKQQIKSSDPNRKDTRFNAYLDPTIINNVFKLKPELSKCTFSNINAKIENNRVKISSGKFSGKISGVDFFSTQIQNSDLTDCEISEKIISNSKLHSCKIISANTMRSEFKKCKLLNVSSMMSELDECNIYKGSYTSCTISKTRIVDDVNITDDCKIIDCEQE